MVNFQKEVFMLNNTPMKYIKLGSSGLQFFSRLNLFMQSYLSLVNSSNNEINRSCQNNI